MFYDVFNGDADGICALHQLRLSDPKESTLVTGVKRDVKLLQRLTAVHDSHITVLDISMDSNKAPLLQLLEQNNTIHYFDHHFSGDIPDHPQLRASIDTSPEVCTSLLVDQYLKGAYRPWAVVAAFGDNLEETAQGLAQETDIAPEELGKLKELGELINYNGYGPQVSDLHFPPAELYQAITPYTDPLDFYEQSTALTKLAAGYQQDMKSALTQTPLQNTEVGRVYRFPAESWGKRIAGVFSNQIAREQPEKAHALLVDNGDGSHLVSVRAPLARPTGADELCRSFPTGGGRAKAAGINQLAESDINNFLQRFAETFAKAST